MGDDKLLSCDSSRTFYIQKLLPPSSVVEKNKENKDPSKSFQQTKRVHDRDLVRTDSKLQRIDAMFMRSANSSPSSSRNSSPMPPPLSRNSTPNNFVGSSRTSSPH